MKAATSCMVEKRADLTTSSLAARSTRRSHDALESADTDIRIGTQ